MHCSPHQFLCLHHCIYFYSLYLQISDCCCSDHDLEPVGIGGEIKQEAVAEVEEAEEEYDPDEDKYPWEP